MLRALRFDRAYHGHSLNPPNAPPSSRADALALCLALCGFGIYQYFGQKHGEVVEKRSFLIRDLSDVDLRASELDGPLNGSFAGASEVGASLDTVGTSWNLNRGGSRSPSPSPKSSIASSATGASHA